MEYAGQMVGRSGGSTPLYYDEVMSHIDRSPWGRALTQEERGKVLASARGASYRSGEAVVKAGFRADIWVGIVEGLVVQSVSAPEGNELFLSAVSDGAWFGEGTLIKRESWQYDAIAIRATQVVLLPAVVFHWLRDTSVAFNHFLQSALNERLAAYTELMVASRTASRADRVARVLRRLVFAKTCTEREPCIRIAQSELGMLVGMSRQRVNEALGELAALGHIKVGRSGITILDLDALATSHSVMVAGKLPPGKLPNDAYK
jgi:CRP-like cAMP-binding protein